MGDAAARRATAPASKAKVVRAAGGILVRPAGRGRLEVATVHRPGRDDWSLPKGKLDGDETWEECAEREVLEETGYRCRVGRFAGTTRYVDRRGRPKVVAYWFMEPELGVRFDDPGGPLMEEVDEVRWLELHVAGRALSYPQDRELLELIAIDL